MKEKLEAYVAKNREEFDDHQINKKDLWKRIERELPPTETPVIPLWRRTKWQVAASIVLVVGSVLFFTSNSNVDQNTIANQELKEVDTYYESLVKDQVALIKNHPNLTKEEQSDFLSLIDDLDAEYDKLKLELKEGVNDKKIMEAIINNYRKKIKLMENLLNKKYSPKKDDDETAYILFYLYLAYYFLEGL